MVILPFLMSYMPVYAEGDGKLLVEPPYSCRRRETAASMIPAAPAMANSKISHCATSGTTIWTAIKKAAHHTPVHQ